MNWLQFDDFHETQRFNCSVRVSKIIYLEICTEAFCTFKIGTIQGGRFISTDDSINFSPIFRVETFDRFGVIRN